MKARKSSKPAPQPFKVLERDGWYIQRQPATRDYALYIGNNYCGSFPTQYDAEQAGNEAMYTVLARAA